MKRALAWSMVVLPMLAGCGNSTDTVDAPTPTPTATPSPTPTPSGLSGTYAVSAAQPTQACTFDAMGSQLNLTFNAPTVNITVDGAQFTPSWGFVTNANLSVPDPEHGTLSGDDFTANYTYCDYDPISGFTTKHIATWTGTFNGDGTFDSSLHQSLRNAFGNQVSSCGAGPSDGTVTTDMMGCTNPGVTWQIHGVRQ